MRPLVPILIFGGAAVMVAAAFLVDRSNRIRAENEPQISAAIALAESERRAAADKQAKILSDNLRENAQQAAVDECGGAIVKQLNTPGTAIELGDFEICIP